MFQLRYGRSMDLDSTIALASVVTIVLSIAGALLGLFLTYLVIRLGVFHGLRSHTRWIDEGKDLRQDRAEPYRR